MQPTHNEMVIMFRGWVRFTYESMETKQPGAITKNKIVNRINSNSRLKHLDSEKTFNWAVENGYLERLEMIDNNAIKYCKVTQKFLMFICEHCEIRLSKKIFDKLNSITSKAQKELDKKEMAQKYVEIRVEEPEEKDIAMIDILNAIQKRGRRLINQRGEKEDYAFEAKFKRKTDEILDGPGYDANSTSLDPRESDYAADAEVEILEEENEEGNENGKPEETVVSSFEMDPDAQMMEDFLKKF